jgi:hypothetical protein
VGVAVVWRRFRGSARLRSSGGLMVTVIVTVATVEVTVLRGVKLVCVCLRGFVEVGVAW